MWMFDMFRLGPGFYSLKYSFLAPLQLGLLKLTPINDVWHVLDIVQTLSHYG